MRTFIRRATLVAALSLCSAAPSAMAASGGASVAPATASAAPADPAATTPPAADPIEVQPVALTRTQTKSVQRRVKVKADGALGSGTRKAIKRYQKVRVLHLTGTPNIETLRSMGLKIADKIEAKLRAQAAVVTNQAVSAPSSSGAAAIAAAQTAIGTPYRSAGTTLAGFDCSGLTQWAYAKAGVKLPRTSFDQYGVGTPIEKSAIQAGDLVFFNSAGAGASHVGIATSPTTVISATTRGVMEHSIASGYWASHYVGARRLADPATAVAASVKN